MQLTKSHRFLTNNATQFHPTQFNSTIRQVKSNQTYKYLLKPTFQFTENPNPLDSLLFNTMQFTKFHKFPNNAYKLQQFSFKSKPEQRKYIKPNPLHKSKTQRIPLVSPHAINQNFTNSQTMQPAQLNSIHTIHQTRPKITGSEREGSRYQ